MKKYFSLSLISLSSLFMAMPVFAGDNPEMVVELFTSQGCSSCPPANEFVGKLSDDTDKLVLSYGVTYWDYLGWKDTFGDQKYTMRQKEYGASLGVGYVYTPQIVLNGRDHDSRFNREDVKKAAKLKNHNTKVDIFESDGRVAIRSNADRVFVVTYEPGWQKIAVKRGENGGRTLKVANVVEDLQVIRKNGLTDISLETGKAYAALVHDKNTHQIIAASVLR